MKDRLKVLIVDDIFTNRLLLTEIMKDLRHDYSEAENGKKALEEIEKNHFDLILMDIEMPVMNGLETTQYLKSKAPAPIRDIPVIALTAHNPSLFFEDFKDIGFTHLLTKPYSVKKIQALIEEVFNE
jgi:CheY-like chemotaxis protein